MQLAERVRAALGHQSDHMRTLEVVVQDGVVTLRGAVPTDELQRVLRAARKVRGVREVRDELNLQEPMYVGEDQSPLG